MWANDSRGPSPFCNGRRRLVPEVHRLLQSATGVQLFFGHDAVLHVKCAATVLPRVEPGQAMCREVGELSAQRRISAARS